MTADGKVALVLGGIKGIGKAISLDLLGCRIRVAATWHDWPDHYVSMVSNRNAKELLEDPWVITMDEINWK